jgi:hypothetical protein
MKLGIILTASIIPMVKGGYFTQEERMDMYMSALRYYAQKIGRTYPIFFVENTNADLTRLRAEFQETLDLTVWQFRPDDPATYEGFDVSRGKGYNEYLMITKCVQDVARNPKYHDVTHFLKITGRYPMLNIRTAIHEIERRVSRKEIVCMLDIKDTKLYDVLHISGHSAQYGDSRFFVFEKNFYLEHMAEAYREMNDYVDGCYAEDYIFNLSLQYRHDNRFIFRFCTQVRFGGISGARYRENYNSLPNRVKAMGRQVLRILFPRIWF